MHNVTTFAILFIRSLCSGMLLGSGDPAAMVTGLAEGHAIFLAIRNWWSDAQVDRSLTGFAVPLCYLAGGAMSPIAGSSIVAELLAIAAVIATVVTRCFLGKSYSVAAPTYTRLVFSGPYRFCRHPLASLSLLSRFLLLMAWPNWTNAALVGFACLFAWVAVLCEERFLSTACEDYEEYKQYVPWRFVPGVF